MAIFSDQTKEEVSRSLVTARNALAKAKEKAQEAIETVVTTGETVGTTFALTYARGRMTDLADPESFQVFGVEPDLLAGLGLHTIGFVVDAKWAGHAHAMANGALCAWAANKGLEFGVEDRQEAGEGPPHRVLSAGAPNFGPNVASRMAQAARARAA